MDNNIIDKAINTLFHIRNNNIVVRTYYIGYEVCEPSQYRTDIHILYWMVVKRLNLDNRKNLLLSNELIDRMILELVFYKKKSLDILIVV